MVLCEIQWVIKFQFTAQEVNHIDKVIEIAEPSGAAFGQLHFVVNAFQNTVGYSRFDKMNDAGPMRFNSFGKVHESRYF